VILEAVIEIRETARNFAFRTTTENFSVLITVNEESEKCFNIVILKLLITMREKSIRCFNIMILKQIRIIDKFIIFIFQVFYCFLIVIDLIRSSIL